MQAQVLEANPNASLNVYVVWSHHLPNDSRGSSNPEILDDQRVVEYWDPIQHFGYTVISRADGLKDHLDEIWATGP